jgi:hypothetical protein
VSGPLEVRVLSDSRITVDILAGRARPSANRDLWAQMAGLLADRRVRVHPAWTRRNDNPFSERCDDLAARARMALKTGASIGADYAEGGTPSCPDGFPSEEYWRGHA